MTGPKLTKLESCWVAPKFFPLIVTTVPAGPDDGLTLLMASSGFLTPFPIMVREPPPPLLVKPTFSVNCPVA